MRQWTALQLRFRSLVSRGTVESELDEELRYHIERQIHEDIAGGMSAEEAQYAARRAFGGYQQFKEECRDMRGWNLMENLIRDIGFAIRQLRKNPLFSVTAVFMLALGISASVAIFAFVDAALLKPLPYKDPARLLGVYETVEHCPHCNLSWLDYVDWKKNNTTLSSLDVYQHTGFTLSTPSGPMPSRASRVSSGFFRTLGVTPILGRDFLPGEDRDGPAQGVILSYSTWQGRYGGRRDILNQTVILDSEPYRIIGVLPADFHFMLSEPSEYWVTVEHSSGCEARRGCHSLNGVGRMKDGVTTASALADIKVVAKQLEVQYPGSNRGQGAIVLPLTEVIVGDIRPILLVLLGGAGLLLMIVTINVSSLLLVRSEARKREISVRTALGAGRGRLIRQFLAEAMVLVTLGGAIGLAGASQLIRLLILLIPADLLAHIPVFANLRVNFVAAVFAAGIALIVALLFSLVPLFRIPPGGLSSGMAEGGRASASLTWRSMGSKLVVFELATAVVLLVGAGLLGRSLALLLHVNLGMQPDRLATLLVAAPDKAYSKDEQRTALEHRVIDRVSSIPGVQSAGITVIVPVSGWGYTTWFRVIGQPWHGEHNDTPFRDVSPEYFRTIGASLLKGRYFTSDDTANKPLVMIVNESMAKQFFSGQDPLGKQITQLGPDVKPIVIVGMVADIKEGPLDTPNQPVLYFPYDQNTDNPFYVVARTAQPDAGALVASMRTAIRELDPGIVTVEESTMNERIEDSQSAWIHRSSTWMVGGFAAMALVLSMIGLYGVIGYSVSQRTREIGIRMALGAQTRSVNRMVMREATFLTGLGIVIGLVCAVAASNMLRSLLFGVQSWDVPTLVAVAAVLSGAALVASYIPARRAACVNPVEALRAE